jgi:hypothetical protein
MALTPQLVAQEAAPAPAAPAPAPAPTNATTPAANPGASTPVQLPLTPPGGIGTEVQLRLAQAQGNADTALLVWVLANSGPFKGDISAGEMRIAFTVTPSEGWWDKAGGGKLVWHDPPPNNVHLRIFVLDLVDGRLVSGLTVHAMLTDANGNEQSVPVDFGWYPLINAYGGNVPIDTDSSYSLRVTVDPLQPRHIPIPGERFLHSTVAEFPPVQIARDAVSALPLATATAFPNEAELLKPCNAALGAAMTALWQQSISGVEQPFGDYFIAYALDFTGPAMQVKGSTLHFKNLLDFTGKQNVRVQILPRDSRTGRLIPTLKPQANLVAADGKLYGPDDLPFVWNPWLNYYGRNVRIPRKGVYKLRVHFDAPSFRRWGQPSERFAAPADIEFDNLSLKLESKKPESKE